MMKAGRQKDILERVTDPLPEPTKAQKRTCDQDRATDEEIQQYIDMCHTEMFANMDEDNALCERNSYSISLNEMRKRGQNNCGFEGIQPINIEETSCLFECSTISDGEQNGVTEEMSITHMGMDQIVTKTRLTELSIRIIRRHVSTLGDIGDRIPNGSAQSIVDWAEAIATDPDTGKIDTCQQRAFEVIVSMFILTFHREANLNEGLQTVGTQHPSNRAQYVKLT
jgi:hypothetical protein